MMGKQNVFNCINLAYPVTSRHHAIACDVYTWGVAASQDLVRNKYDFTGFISDLFLK